MSEITVRLIDQAHKDDINLPNEPFPIYGRMIPAYMDEKWDYTIELFPEEQITEDCFPDENYNYEAMRDEYAFVGAYDGDRCIGLAILKDDWFKYMYLDDLKISRDYRGKGIGTLLIQKSVEVARSRGFHSLYTIGQDNNLGACKFYLHAGFQIGGFDNHIYKGTVQEDKANILFYLDEA